MRFATAIGAYEIDSVPSQPQVAHCHAFFVPKDLRGRGLAHTLKTHQNVMLAALGLPMVRVGKRAAGRLLDEVQHDGYPA